MSDAHCRDGELRFAIGTAQHGFTINDPGNFFLPAFRANWASGPAQLFQELPALALAIKSRHKLRKPNARKNSRNGSHDGHAPMKRKKKKSDRQVLKELFPPGIVKEADAVLED